MATYKVEALKIEPTLLGEGPHWDAERQTLYFVDIIDSVIGSYHPATGKSSRIKIDTEYLGESGVGLLVPIAGSPNEFIIGHGRSLKRIHWDGHSDTFKVLNTLYEASEEKILQGRFNDGKCDSSGRLWAGTMGVYHPQPSAEDLTRGTLYTVDNQGNVTPGLLDVGVSNGLAWSPDNSTFYFIDSYANRVDAFDYDAPTGKLSNRRPVFDFKKEKESGIPDGMTIDANGHLWVACFDGSQVVKIDPVAGKVVDRVKLPTSYITSVAFGGKNLDELYVTSVKGFFTPEQLKEQPDAGAIFKVTNLGVVGLSAGVSYNPKK